MRIVSLFLLSLLASSVTAEEVTFDTIMDSIEEELPERTTTGTIHEIDLAARTGVIGGYLYHFGPSTDPYPLKVKLLGKNFGSLEMLSVGMDVEVYYFVAPGGHRVANELVQIEKADEF